MSSKAGPRAEGTDGTDYKHRQRVASHYQESADNKFLLKFLFGAHLLILTFMWTKVGAEILMRDFGWNLPFFKKLDLPSAAPWEYMYCLSFIPIIFGLLSFSRNKVHMINKCWYGQFLLGIFPVLAGMGGQILEMLYYAFGPEGTPIPHFMVFIWFIFVVLALQIHYFIMQFCESLATVWSPAVKKNE